MPGGCFSARLELSYRKYQWKCQNIEPSDHAETIHKRQEHALVQQLLIDNAQGGRPGIRGGEAVMSQLRGERMGSLLDTPAFALATSKRVSCICEASGASGTRAT